MKRELELLQKESTQSVLEESERRALRDSLVSYMERNPVRDAEAVASKKASGLGITNTLLGLLLLFIFAAGGVAYAAENTVPGDHLYTFKRSINEPVRSFFALSDQSKANLDVDLANERLVEAEKLQSTSRLTPSEESALSADLNKHVEAFQNHIKVLASENNDTDATLAESHLEASLEAHAAVVPMLMKDVELSNLVYPLTASSSLSKTP